jgi:hypothetical protein
MGLSIGIFVVGVVIVSFGLYMLAGSGDLTWRITGGVLAAFTSAVTAFSSRFWKDPVEHIQGFLAQQARLQTAFIGYMNRVAQLRLVFEKHYSAAELTLEDLEQYQSMLSDAMDQVSQQLETRSEGREKEQLR